MMTRDSNSSPTCDAAPRQQQQQQQPHTPRAAGPASTHAMQTDSGPASTPLAAAALIQPPSTAPAGAPSPRPPVAQPSPRPPRSVAPSHANAAVASLDNLSSPLSCVGLSAKLNNTNIPAVLDEPAASPLLIASRAPLGASSFRRSSFNSNRACGGSPQRPQSELCDSNTNINNNNNNNSQGNVRNASRCGSSSQLSSVICQHLSESVAARRLSLDPHAESPKTAGLTIGHAINGNGNGNGVVRDSNSSNNNNNGPLVTEFVRQQQQRQQQQQQQQPSSVMTTPTRVAPSDGDSNSVLLSVGSAFVTPPPRMTVGQSSGTVNPPAINLVSNTSSNHSKRTSQCFSTNSLALPGDCFRMVHSPAPSSVNCDVHNISNRSNHSENSGEAVDSPSRAQHQRSGSRPLCPPPPCSSGVPTPLFRNSNCSLHRNSGNGNGSVGGNHSSSVPRASRQQRSSRSPSPVVGALTSSHGALHLLPVLLLSEHGGGAQQQQGGGNKEHHGAKRYFTKRTFRRQSPLTARGGAHPPRTSSSNTNTNNNPNSSSNNNNFSFVRCRKDGGGAGSANNSRGMSCGREEHLYNTSGHPHQQQHLHGKR